MKRFLFASVVLFSAITGKSQSFSSTYNFSSVTTSSGTTDPTTVPTASGLTFGSFSATGTPVNPNASGRFSFTDWSLGATNASNVFTGGIVTTEYYEVTLTPSVGYTIDLNTITFTLQRSGTGIRQYSVRSSLDGYAVNLPASINPTNANLSVVATDIFQVDDASTSPNTGSTITLDATFDNLTSAVTFRFYGWNAEASGGTFSIDDVVFNGVATYTGSITNFYSKSSGNLTDVATWGINTDGTGTQPINFTTDGQVFNVVNRVSVTLDANWTVSGASSKVIVGDGLGATILILPVGAALTGTIDVSNLGTLQLVNTTLPTFGTMQSGSTVEYAQTTTPYTVPTGTTYHHLTISSGGAGNVKTFASGTIFVNGNLVVDGVTGFNGSATPFTTVNLAGNFTLQNSAAFEPIGSGEGNRMSLICSGTGTQTLSGGDFYIFRIQTPATGTITIALSSANLTLGNPSGGGFDLRLASHTLSIGSNTLTLNRAGIFYGTNVGTLSGTGSSNLIIDKTTGSAAIGSIGFASGAQSLNNFTYNSAGSGSNDLSLTSSLTTGGTITLTAGKINIGANTLTSSGTILGGSSTSYIQTTSVSGNLVLANVTGARNAPIGNSTYNPLTITNTSGHNWTVHVEDILTVDDPLFASNILKAVQREWHITPSTNPPTTGADLVFQWDDSDPTQIGTSYTNTEMVQIWREVSSGQPWGNDWVAVGTSQTATGTPPGVRTATKTNWSLYSPFAISNISGPLPIKLISFNAVKINSGLSRLNWELAVCCSSAARFEVQKSTDGRNYSTFATVGGSETNRFYVSNDNNLGKGITYYRLKMVDVGNVVTYSKIVALVNDSNELLITSVAPNPVQDITTLTLSTGRQGNATFNIYDVSGNMVKQWQAKIAEGNNTIELNVSSLPAGMYHVLVATTDARTVTRFVKQ